MALLNPAPDLPLASLTYRVQLRQLARQATPAPWESQGELYGIRTGHDFKPLGFAPHRPLDAELIACYRSTLIELLNLLNAIEQLLLRAYTNPNIPVAINLRQLLVLFDATADPTPFRIRLSDLDQNTTSGPWDPAHLSIGQDFSPASASQGIANPAPADPYLIAACRLAVPRALRLLDQIEIILHKPDPPSGCLRPSCPTPILAALRAFDAHQTSEGNNTSTI